MRTARRPRVAPPAVTLQELECTPTGPDTGTCEVVGSREVMVSARLRAVSGLTRMARRESFKDEGCTLSFSSRSAGREAVGVVALDGERVGGRAVGSIERGTVRMEASCG